jgi:hypothetical protein
MKTPYGPWATSIDAGGNPQLSAFWRRRMTRLVATSRTSPVLSRRCFACLLAVGAMMLAVPTFRSATIVADEAAKGAVQPDTKADAPTPDAASDAPCISGVVVDGDKRPVQEALVCMFETSHTRESEHLLRKTHTDAQGGFRLLLPSEKKLCKLTISKKGFASRVIGPYHPLPPEFAEFVLSAPQSLRGRVTGPDGQPIAGADVWTPFLRVPIAGIHSAKTDANGYYEIPDLMAWDGDAMPMFDTPPTPEQLKEAEARVRAARGTKKILLRVRHPDYGRKLGPYSRIPETVDVSFDRPAVVTGRLVDPSTGKPLAGILAKLQEDKTHAYAQTATDEGGVFRLLLQGSGACRLWFEGENWRSPERTVQVVSGSTLDVSEIRITPSDFVRAKK